MVKRHFPHSSLPHGNVFDLHLCLVSRGHHGIEGRL